jgi:hypothetical protein
MVVPNEVPVPTYAPLREQRRGLRERALPVLDDRHSDQSSGTLPADAPAESGSRSARRRWDTPRAFIQTMIGRRRARPAGMLVSRTAPQPTLSSAATEAALAQRITGLGSGPYSGTPFLVVPRMTDGVEQPPAPDAPCEAARHDHGIIDHSRHVASIGRR